MISIGIFIIVSIILYIGIYILLGKYRVNIFVGIFLMLLIPGIYNDIRLNGKLLNLLHLEKSDDLEFISFIFIFLYAFLFMFRMKFKR